MKHDDENDYDGDTTLPTNDASSAPAATISDLESTAPLIEAVENLIGSYSREFILCVLLTVTVNAIHVIEDRAMRRRTEEQYIKALRFLSAVEEQFQPDDQGDPPDWADECMALMMRHVFHAIGLGVTPDE